MSTLSNLFDHALWADARAHAATAGIDPARSERAQAIRLYAHIAAAEHVWLARLEGRAQSHAVWPELSLDAAAELSRESLAALREIAMGDERALSREVEYRNSAGQTYRNRVVDILTQVALHGCYHRGQIALLARQGGVAPAATDYIVFVRDIESPPG
jgi:uncharacterized damage-inducible protein DinB